MSISSNDMLNYYEGTCPQRKSASIIKIGYSGLLMTIFRMTVMSCWELRREIHREFCQINQIILMLHVFQEKKYICQL